MRLPPLRHPDGLLERTRRKSRVILASITRRFLDRDYRTMRWLVDRYRGPTEVQRVFFINLDSSPDRRADMEKSLAAVRAPFERYPGIHGSEDRAAYRQYLEQRPPLPPSRRPSGEIVPYEVTDGMIGCWLSHVHLLEHISTLEEGLYLVLEDDYHLPRDWRQRIEALLSEIPDDWDIPKLYSVALNGKPRLRGVRVSDSLVRLGPALLTQQNLSTAAYVVRHRTPRTREIKEAFEKGPVMHVDDALNFVMDDVRVYAPRKRIGSLTALSVFSTR